MASYTVCKKCGLRHSTLVKHRCAKVKKQETTKLKDPTEHEAETGLDVTTSLDEHDGEAEGEEGGEGEGEADAGSDGEADGEGEGEGEGEGDSEDSDGEGEEREGKRKVQVEVEGEGPAPQPPEPEARPEAIICTVLKFAALTAQCAKNGTIEITVTEDGLMVYGHNGDLYAVETMTWKDFEDRSTVDGEFFVKEVIDRIDGKLLQADSDIDRVKQLIDSAKALKASGKAEKGKSEAKEPVPFPDTEPEKAKLTVPMFVGQRVVCRDGNVREVKSLWGNPPSAVQYRKEDGHHYVFSGHAKYGRPETAGRGRAASEQYYDALFDAPSSPKAEEKKLTLPLEIGQKVVAKNGEVGDVVSARMSAAYSSRSQKIATVHFYNGDRWEYVAKNGLWGGEEDRPDYEWHIDRDA